MTEKEIIARINRCIKKGDMEYQFIATDDKDKDADFSFTTDGFFVIYVSKPPTYTPFCAEDFKRILYGNSRDKEDINYLEFHFYNDSYYHIDEDGEEELYYRGAYIASSDVEEKMKLEYKKAKNASNRLNLIISNLNGLENEIIELTCTTKKDSYCDEYLNSEIFQNKVEALENETKALLDSNIPLILKQKLLFCYSSVCLSMWELIRDYDVSRFFRPENAVNLLVQYDNLWEFVEYLRSENKDVMDNKDIEKTVGQVFTVAKRLTENKS